MPLLVAQAEDRVNLTTSRARLVVRRHALVAEVNETKGTSYKHQQEVQLLGSVPASCFAFVQQY